eukprot:TRINITY_DN153_c0_g3_i1.p1 TRINITY_DN153_c0_g3~~TRINITY_DN153_c0_g3_i1.p1  ORF type:complete len:1295 (+),score=211.18 TRINITY_DN153_c0_g3_i1:77-3961(+)
MEKLGAHRLDSTKDRILALEHALKYKKWKASMEIINVNAKNEELAGKALVIAMKERVQNETIRLKVIELGNPFRPDKALHNLCPIVYAAQSERFEWLEGILKMIIWNELEFLPKLWFRVLECVKDNEDIVDLVFKALPKGKSVSLRDLVCQLFTIIPGFNAFKMCQAYLAEIQRGIRNDLHDEKKFNEMGIYLSLLSSEEFTQKGFTNGVAYMLRRQILNRGMNTMNNFLPMASSQIGRVVLGSVVFDRDKLVKSYTSVHGDVLPLEYEKEYFARFNWSEVGRDVDVFLKGPKVPVQVPVPVVNKKEKSSVSSSPKKVKKKRNPFKNAFGTKSLSKAVSISKKEVKVTTHDNNDAKGAVLDKKCMKESPTKPESNGDENEKSSNESLPIKHKHMMTKKKNKKKKKNPFKNAFAATTADKSETIATTIDPKQLMKTITELTKTDESTLVYRGSKCHSIEEFNNLKAKHKRFTACFEVCVFTEHETNAIRIIRSYLGCGIDIDIIVPSIKSIPKEILLSTSYMHQGNYPNGMNFLMEILLDPNVPTYFVSEVLKRMTKEEVRLIVPSTISLVGGRNHMTALNIAISTRCNGEILALLLNKMEYLQQEIITALTRHDIETNVNRHILDGTPLPNEVNCVQSRVQVFPFDEAGKCVPFKTFQGDKTAINCLSSWCASISAVCDKKVRSLTVERVKYLYCAAIDVCKCESPISDFAKIALSWFTEALRLDEYTFVRAAIDYMPDLCDYFVYSKKGYYHTLAISIKHREVVNHPELHDLHIQNLTKIFQQHVEILKRNKSADVLTTKVLMNLHVALGYCALFLHKWNEAKKSIEKAFALDDQSPIIWHAKHFVELSVPNGDLYTALGYLRRSLSDYEKSRGAVNDTMMQLYSSCVGDCIELFKTKRYDKGLNKFRELMKFDSILTRYVVDYIIKFKKQNWLDLMPTSGYNHQNQFLILTIATQPNKAPEYLHMRMNLNRKHSKWSEALHDADELIYFGQYDYFVSKNGKKEIGKRVEHNFRLEAKAGKLEFLIRLKQYSEVRNLLREIKWKKWLSKLDLLASLVHNGFELIYFGQYDYFVSKNGKKEIGKRVEHNFRLEAKAGKLEFLIRLKQYSEVRNLLREIKWKKWLSKLDLLASLVHNGFELINSHHKDLGIIILKEAIKVHSKTVKVEVDRTKPKLILKDYFMHCYTLMKTKDYSVAIEMANISRFIFDNDHEAMAAFHLVEAKAHRLKRNFQASIQDCKEALKLKPNCGRVFFEMSLTHMIEGNIVKSKKAAKKCLELNSEQSKYASMILQELE